MGVLDAAMHAEEMKRRGFQDIRDAMGQITETNKASRFKEAGKRLAELGGLSKENLKQVVTEFRLDAEQTKELITTWGSFHKTMREMEGKKKDYGTKWGYRDEQLVRLSEDPSIAIPEGAKLASTVEAEMRIRGGKDKDYAATNYILPNKETVLSYDRGKTYVGEDGLAHRMPYGAIKVPGATTLTEMRTVEATKQADKELGKPQLDSAETVHRPSAVEAALEGTGPYRALASLVEAVAGGLGIDRLIGKEGLFPKTAQNKQLLRAVRQIGKTALIMSPRYPVREQEIVEQLFPNPDKFWVNPRVESKKLIQLKQILNEEKKYNLEAIAKSIYPKEVEKYRNANNDIDRLLSLLATNENKSILSEEESALVEKYSPK